MVSINYATREVSCKIVYYGPGLSGKTTNLQYVHNKIPSDTKGKLISLATDADRTLYFDFLPINIGTINGFAAKFQLYTVPGQVYYNATRKLVLRGVDGIVFVADSQPDKMDENIESMNNLKENLAEYGYNLADLPMAIQYNKHDLPGVLGVEEMKQALNTENRPEFKASATEGFGVFDTLKCILKLVLDKAKASGAGASPQPTESGLADRTMEAPPRQPVPPQEAAPPQPVMSPSSPGVPVEPIKPQPVYDAVAQQKTVTVEQPPEAPYSGSESPERFDRDQVRPSPETRPEPTPMYRPFPGNTLEDEERMDRLRRQRDAIDGKKYSTMPQHRGLTDDKSSAIGSWDDTEDYNSSPSPRMAPSLRAEKPHKKRSFFKRLFGLK